MRAALARRLIINYEYARTDGFYADNGDHARRGAKLPGPSRDSLQKRQFGGKPGIGCNILAITPRDFEVLTAVGNLSFQLGDMAVAANAFARAAFQCPDDPGVQVLLAAAAVKCGEVKVFEQAMARAFKLDPVNLPGLLLLAKLNLEQGRLADAAKNYFQILRLDENNVEASIGIGVCFFKQGNRDMARKSFERVLTLQPGNTLATENLKVINSGKVAGEPGTPEGLRLILGVGRSGTSWVGKVLSKTTAPTRFFSEALFHVKPKLPYRQQAITRPSAITETLMLIPCWPPTSCSRIRVSRMRICPAKNGMTRVGRMPGQGIHALLGSEALLRAWKIPVLFILRDPVYILDSLFAAQTLETNYLDHESAAVREAAFLDRFAPGVRDAVRKALSENANSPRRCRVMLDKLICIHLLQKMFTTLAAEFPQAKVFAYEDFCQRPVETFQAAARSLGIPWDEKMAAFLQESMRGNAKAEADPYAVYRNTSTQKDREFQFLSPEEIALCRATLVGISNPPVAQKTERPRPQLTENDPLRGLEEGGVWRKGQPLRLHLGCGEQHFDGYINIDYPPANHNVMTIQADAYANVLKLNFPPNSVDEIRLHHVFEHFNRVTALAMLMKWHVWLKEGGVLRIETPDLVGSAKTLASPTASYRLKMAAARHLAGDQAASWGYHLDHWFPERYQRTLTRLGFGPVKVFTSSWRHEPHLANVEVIGLKKKRTQAEQIQAGDELLWKCTVAEAERPTFEVWRQQLRALVNEGAMLPAPINAVTPDISKTEESTHALEKNVIMLVVSKDRPCNWPRHWPPGNGIASIPAQLPFKFFTRLRHPGCRPFTGA